MKIKKWIFLGVLLTTTNYADQIVDSDFDGVADSIDQCPNTPFLNEVNSLGCTVHILTLPSETNQESLTFSLGYGYSTNEDLIDREIQRNTNLQLSYYKNNWSYSVHTGYYTHKVHDGLLDTTVSIKKRVKFDSNIVLGIGGGFKLPTHSYKGNRVDVIAKTSLHYYPTSALSYFAGYSFTRIGDNAESIALDVEMDNNQDKESTALQNMHKFYVGTGYFITADFYANLSYSLEESKFRDEHNIQALSASLYYKIDEKWFTSLYYKRQIDDEDIHDNLIFKIGYHIW